MNLYFKRNLTIFINKLLSWNYTRRYSVQKLGVNEYRVVKILNVYEDPEEACKNMVYVATNRITELELLKDCHFNEFCNPFKIK